MRFCHRNLDGTMKVTKTENIFLIWKRGIQCKQATMAQLEMNDNAFVFTDKENLSQCETFYEELCSSKTAIENNTALTFPPYQNETFLNAEEQPFCEGLIKEEEYLEVLKNVISDKTPRTNGLPCDFIRSEVGEILANALNHSYEAGMPLISQRRGVIKLIPKKDAEPNFLIAFLKLLPQDRNQSYRTFKGNQKRSELLGDGNKRRPGHYVSITCF